MTIKAKRQRKLPFKRLLPLSWESVGGEGIRRRYTAYSRGRRLARLARATGYRLVRSGFLSPGYGVKPQSGNVQPSFVDLLIFYPTAGLRAKAQRLHKRRHHAAVFHAGIRDAPAADFRIIPHRFFH